MPQRLLALFGDIALDTVRQYARAGAAVLRFGRVAPGPAQRRAAGAS